MRWGPPWGGSGGSPLLAHRRRLSPVSAHGGESGRLSKVTCYKGTVPSRGAAGSPPNSFPEASPPNPITLGRPQLPFPSPLLCEEEKSER